METQDNKVKDFYWNLLIELRKEIIESQKLRAQIIGFKITFVSAGIGVIVANSDKLPLPLLAIPAFAAIFFDLLIESYSFSVKRIGFYCRKYVEPYIRKSTQLDESFLLWEEFMQKPETKQLFTTVGNLGLTCLAVVPAMVALFVPFVGAISIPVAVLLCAFFFYDVHTFMRIGRIREIGLESKKLPIALQGSSQAQSSPNTTQTA
jgi:hypothetical protein